MVKKLNFCSVLSAKFSQDVEVEVKARSEAGVWSVLSADVEVMKLNLGRDSEGRFCQD